MLGGEAPSHYSKIMIGAKIKSWTLSQLSHPCTPEISFEDLSSLLDKDEGKKGILGTGLKMKARKTELNADM